MVSRSRPPVVVGFIDHNSRFKSAGSLIPHDAGLALFRLAGDRTRVRCVRGSDSASVPQRWICRKLLWRFWPRRQGILGVYITPALTGISSENDNDEKVD